MDKEVQPVKFVLSVPLNQSSCHIIKEKSIESVCQNKDRVMLKVKPHSVKSIEGAKEIV